MSKKRRAAALTAEFLGTGVLSFVFLTVSRSSIGLPYFIGLAAGLVIVAMGLALSRDVQLNPAYTLALWTARRMRTFKALAFIAAQMLGGWAAYALYKYLVEGSIQPIPGKLEWHPLVAEAFGTFIFAFMAAGALYRQAHGLVRSVTAGLGYTLAIITASTVSIGFANPAVALGSNGLTWVAVLGPVLGAVIGVNLYGLLFAREDEVTVASFKAGWREKAADVAAARTDGDVEAVEAPARPKAAKKTTRKPRAKKS